MAAFTKYQEPVQEFSSLGELIEYNEKTPQAPNWVEHGNQVADRSRYNGNPEWSGVSSYQEAINLAVNGWPDGLKMITQKMELNRAQTDKARRSTGVTGDFPIVGKYLANQPDCMSRRIRGISSKRPIIELNISLWRASQVDHETIINRGAALAIFIDSLEDAGYSVSLKAGQIGSLFNEKLGYTVEIKQPGEILDLGRLVYVLGHPSMQRRIGFAFQETVAESKTLNNNGGTMYVRYQDKNPDVISFDSLTTRNEFPSVTAALDSIKETARKIRPELFEDENQAA